MKKLLGVPHECLDRFRLQVKHDGFTSALSVLHNDIVVDTIAIVHDEYALVLRSRKGNVLHSAGFRVREAVAGQL